MINTNVFFDFTDFQVPPASCAVGRFFHEFFNPIGTHELWSVETSVVERECVRIVHDVGCHSCNSC